MRKSDLVKLIEKEISTILNEALEAEFTVRDYEIYLCYIQVLKFFGDGKNSQKDQVPTTILDSQTTGTTIDSAGKPRDYDDESTQYLNKKALEGNKVNQFIEAAKLIIDNTKTTSGIGAALANKWRTIAVNLHRKEHPVKEDVLNYARSMKAHHPSAEVWNPTDIETSNDGFEKASNISIQTLYTIITAPGLDASKVEASNAELKAKSKKQHEVFVRNYLENKEAKNIDKK